MKFLNAQSLAEYAELLKHQSDNQHVTNVIMHFKSMIEGKQGRGEFKEVLCMNAGQAKQLMDAGFRVDFFKDTDDVSYRLYVVTVPAIISETVKE